MSDNASTSISSSNNSNKRQIMVTGGAVMFAGMLSVPADARALIVLAYDHVSEAQYTLDNLSALEDASNRSGLATLSVNLLTPEEEEMDKMTGFFRENVSVLHQRIVGIANWLIENIDTKSLVIGYFGIGVCAAAALAAAVVRPDAVNAIVTVAPRIDLLNSDLSKVVTPTLLIAAENDLQTLDMARKALSARTSNTTLGIATQSGDRAHANTLETIPGVSNVFENQQTVQQIEQLSIQWFTRYLLV